MVDLLKADSFSKREQIMGSKTRAGFGTEEKGFRWGIFILLMVLYALFLNPRCWPKEQESVRRGGRSQESASATRSRLAGPFTIFSYRANPYVEPKLKLLGLAGPASSGGRAEPEPIPPQAGPHNADQVLLSVYDAVNGALKANATLSGGSTNPTLHNADQVFLAVYDAVNGALRVNVVAGGGAIFQVNGTGLASSSTVNFQNSAATNGLTLTFANPSSGNIQLGLSGTLADAGLASGYSGVGACAANSWASTLARNAAPTCTQPAFSNISGTVGASQLPAPTASTMGGIKSLAQTTHQWINSISTSGVPASSQPGVADLSDTPSQGKVLAGPSAYGAAAANGTYRALVPGDIPAGLLSCAILDNAICTSSVDAAGNPNFLAADSTAPGVDVNGGTTPLTYFVGGVYQQINSQLVVTPATPASDTAYFVIVKQDTAHANPVSADLVATNIVPAYQYTAPTCSASASTSNPHFWYNLAANMAEWCTSNGGSFSAQASLVLGVAVVSSSPTVIAVLAEPYRLNPYKRFETFGDGSTGVSLVTTTSNLQTSGNCIVFLYSFLLIDAGSASATGSWCTTVVQSQNPILLINSGVINFNAVGQNAITGTTGAGSAGKNAGYGGGTGGGGGGAGVSNAGAVGGNGPYFGIPWTSVSAGSAGSVGNPGGNGKASFGTPGPKLITNWYALGEGASGGSGGGDGTNAGGNGGASGGLIVIFAPSILVASGSSVTANGAAGGNGAGGSAGGGGGGGGGTAIIAAGFITNGAGGTYTPTATGGAYGTSPGTGGHGGTGGNGVALAAKLW